MLMFIFFQARGLNLRRHYIRAVGIVEGMPLKPANTSCSSEGCFMSDSSF
jgi:hypothetical protein